VFLFFIGPIALRWVGLIWLFLDFVTALTNEAVAIAHLSGSAAGMIIGYAFRQGWRPENLIQAIREYFEGPQEISQEEVDRILEKIHAKGIRSLSRRELRILQKATERL
jgi:DNA-binding NarL/FixJ family response regulator